MKNENEYIKYNDKECGRTCFVLVKQDFCSSVDTYGFRHRWLFYWQSHVCWLRNFAARIWFYCKNQKVKQKIQNSFFLRASKKDETVVAPKFSSSFNKDHSMTASELDVKRLYVPDL